MPSEKRVIKKYPNRRLYDTANSCYITLADVKQLVLESMDIQVVDAKSGEDLTRSVLLQIILDEEAGGAPMFSYDVLTQMIRTYGNAMQGLMGSYLEKNMQAFVEMQERLAQQAQSVMQGGTPTFANPGVWDEFMKYQSPNNLQDMMGSYLEQGTKAFLDLQKQASSMFGGLTTPCEPEAPVKRPGKG